MVVISSRVHALFVVPIKLSNVYKTEYIFKPAIVVVVVVIVALRRHTFSFGKTP